MFIIHVNTNLLVALRTKRTLFMFILLFVDRTYQLDIKIITKHINDVFKKTTFLDMA